MTEDQRLELRNQIEQDYAEYRVELEKRQRMIDNQEESVLKEIIGDIEAAVNQVAAQENYHLILNAPGGSRSTVLWSSPAIEVTSKVSVVLNASAN